MFILVCYFFHIIRSTLHYHKHTMPIIVVALRCWHARRVLARYEWGRTLNATVDFQLGDLLIKPIQRIQKYHLLVKKILSYTQSANQPPEVLAELEDAVLCTSIIPKNANDMMDVGRLQGFTVTLSFSLSINLLNPACAAILNIVKMQI